MISYYYNIVYWLRRHSTDRNFLIMLASFWDHIGTNLLASPAFHRPHVRMYARTHVRMYVHKSKDFQLIRDKISIAIQTDLEPHWGYDGARAP